MLAAGCGTAPPAGALEKPTASVPPAADISALQLPALDYEHPYRRHAEAALASITAEAGKQYRDAFLIECVPKASWCAIRSTQPDVVAVDHVVRALNVALHRERPGLGVVLYSAKDVIGFVEFRLLIARHGQLEQQPHVVVSETSKTFAERVVHAARSQLPWYLAENLQVDCARAECGATLTERSQATFDKVLAATQRACAQLQCEILVTEQEANAAGMQRGRLSITRFLRMI